MPDLLPPLSPKIRLQELAAVAEGKGVVPKSGNPIIAAHWLASEQDLENDPHTNPKLAAPAPTANHPTIKTLRAHVAPKRPAVQSRDWDIVTPPSSPTHFDEFCSLSDIVARREGHERFPILNPATPGVQVIPFRFVGA